MLDSNDKPYVQQQPGGLSPLAVPSLFCKSSQKNWYINEKLRGCFISRQATLDDRFGFNATSKTIFGTAEISKALNVMALDCFIILFQVKSENLLRSRRDVRDHMVHHR